MIELRKTGLIILDGEVTNFKAQEFLPPEIYNHPTRNPLWFLDQDTIAMVQFCRNWFAVPVYLNNWARGGDRDLAGYRTPETGIIDHLIENGLSKKHANEIKEHMLSIGNNSEEELTLGSWLSQHKFSKAADPIFKGISANDVRKEIQDFKEAFISAGITTLESGRYAPTWVHMDRRPTGLNSLLIVGT